MRPRYIALDEPTAFPDPAASGRVRSVMDRLRSEGVGIIHITHKYGWAALPQRILVMSRGVRRSGLLAGVKSFVLLTSKIISGVFRRADEIALAMDARNYQRGERSSFAELKFASADYLIMVVLCFSLVIFVALNLYFG